MERRDLGRKVWERLGALRSSATPRREVERSFRVLAYRRFWPPTPELKKAFAQQLEYLRFNYVVVSLPELVQDLVYGRAPVENSLCITIDGGHRDFFSVAYPALWERGLQATVFLPTGFIDGGTWLWFDRIIYALRNTKATSLEVTSEAELPIVFPLENPEQRRNATSHLFQTLQKMPPYERDPLMHGILERLGMMYPPYPPPEYAPLTWDQVSEMWPHNISFGAQSVSHPTLTAMAGEGEIHAEMAGSKQRIEQKLGIECSLFCYPGGAWDDRVVETAKNCGFLGAVTAHPGANSHGCDRFRIRRTSVDPVLPIEQFARRCKE